MIVTRPMYISSVGAQALLGNAIVALIAITVTYALSRFDALSFGAFGLGNPSGDLRHFLFGLCVGGVLLSGLLLLLRIVSGFRFGNVSTQGLDATEFAVLYAALFLVVAFPEETLVRAATLRPSFRKAFRSGPQPLC
jgi:hypothetical protein